MGDLKGDQALAGIGLIHADDAEGLGAALAWMVTVAPKATVPSVDGLTTSAVVLRISQ